MDPSIKPDAGLPDASTGSDAGPIADATVPPDGYQPDSLTEREGCGCRGASNAPDGWLLVLLALLLGQRRTPRRRSRPWVSIERFLARSQEGCPAVIARPRCGRVNLI